jgi:dipeptidyl aminopeptidase/acylaminoacyl peptidase
MGWWRALLIVAALALAGEALAAKPAPAPPPDDGKGPLPIDAFYKDAAIAGAEISPSGDAIAMIRQDGDKEGVLVHDLTTHQSKIIFVNGDKGIYFTKISWKGDQRLIISVTVLKIDRAGGSPTGEILAIKYGKLLVAIDRDGKNRVILMKADPQTARRSGHFLYLADALRADPDHVLVAAPTAGGAPALWRADIRTGAAIIADTGDDDTLQWWIDRTGVPIARLEAKGRDLIYQSRGAGQTKWTEVKRVRVRDIVKAIKDFDILGPAEQPGQLYVLVKPETPDQGAARAVRTFDVNTNKLGPPVWPGLNYDVDSIVTDENTDALLGVCYWVDVKHCDFKDAELQANFRGLDKFFGGDRSLTTISRSDDGRWWLFEVSGPDEPSSYYLFDWQKKSMDWLGSLFPNLPPEKLGKMERFTYKARDGTSIPAYVTRPPGAPDGPLPLVVIPHGGPEARDGFDYDTWSQIIATRGYLVLQPNFRGSSGYGVAFAESGYGQWGARMQDDITDGVQALIAAGKVDPKRICIFGASYGGYAALIGGALQPDLYKCVVSWAGVSDLEKLMRLERGGLFVGERSPAYDYDLKAIGDPDTDKARLARTSAITYAATYGPPVLLISGDSDTVVPFYQTKDMDAALKAAGKDVKLLIFKDEDHSDWDTDNEKKAMSEVVAFIEAHIPPAKLAPVPMPADTSSQTPAAAPAAKSP